MEALNQILFSLGSYNFQLHQLISILLVLVFGFSSFRWLKHYLNPRVAEWSSIEEKYRVRFLKIIRLLFVFLTALGLIYFLNLPWKPWNRYIMFLFQALTIIQVSRLLDWIVSHYYIHRRFVKRDDKPSKAKSSYTNDERVASKTVQYLVTAIALILIFESLNFDYTFYSFEIKKEEIPLKLSKILEAIVIIFIGRLLIWIITQLILYGYYKQREIDVGAQFAINQLITYVGYFVTILIAMSTLGINVTLLWGGAAALLVGVGLGLQSTFNDFFSGIVLLFERSVHVGDVIQMDNFVGTVKKIGLRASIMEARDSVSVIVPNSKLVNQNVINWSHTNNIVRFDINVGVAYGTDTKLIKKLLLDAAEATENILSYPAPFVRFRAFGDSSLNFELHFFTIKLIQAEDIKSNLHFEIDDRFRKHNIKIPFPQREVYVNSPDK